MVHLHKLIKTGDTYVYDKHINIDHSCSCCNPCIDCTKAEAELKAREKRVESLTIIPLTPSEAARFSQTWKDLQGRFVDDPKGAVVQAGELVRELMLKRGYPMGDFERRAADISVDHSAVAANYRAAQAITVRDERGETDTEELRKAWCITAPSLMSCLR